MGSYVRPDGCRVEVYRLDMGTNRYGRPLYPQCDASDPGQYRSRCGAEAGYGLTVYWPDGVKRYAAYSCRRHLSDAALAALERGDPVQPTLPNMPEPLP